MKQGQKKKRNVKGRKNPAFAEMIMTIYRDSLVTLDEMMEKKPNREYDTERGRMVARYDDLPDHAIVVDSLQGVNVFHEIRLFRHLDRIKLALNEFDVDHFSKPEGASLQDLRFDRKDRVWGAEPHIFGLAYLAIAGGMAEWTQPRKEWQDNEDKYPRIRFTKSVTENDESENENDDAANSEEKPASFENGPESNATL